MNNEVKKRQSNVDDAIKFIESAIDGLKIEGYQIQANDPKSFDMILSYNGHKVPCEGHIEKLLRVDDFIVGKIKDRLGIS